MQIEKKFFGTYTDHNVDIYTISNGTIRLSVSQLGCAITAIIVPGNDGVERNVVLGYGSLEGYINDTYYVGATIGRYAGRISQASFEMDGTTYDLSRNDLVSGCHLHGGYHGFNKKVFRLISEKEDGHNVSVTFFYRSNDMEEGYPGNLDLWVTYTLNIDNEIIISYKALTDKKTPVNLTNHSYFNFSGVQQPATDHKLFIDSDAFVESDSNYIPSGKIIPVTNTVYDFKKAKVLNNAGGHLPYGYNDCFVFNNNNGTKATLYHPASGISMNLATSFPGLLLYSGYFLNNNFISSQGICLETQFLPDSVHQQGFPSTLLSPFETFNHYTKFSFRL